MYRFTLVYNNDAKHGTWVPDESAEQHILIHINDLNTKKLTISNGILLTAARCLWAEEKLDCDEFVVEYEGEDFFVNEYGVMDWPAGMGDQSNRLTHRLLRAAMNKRKAEKHV